MLIANAGYTPDAAEAVLARGDADLVAFGVPFLATPDFVERTREGVAANAPDRGTFYGGDQRGYVDYPFRDGTVKAVARRDPRHRGRLIALRRHLEQRREQPHHRVAEALVGGQAHVGVGR